MNQQGNKRNNQTGGAANTLYFLIGGAVLLFELVLLVMLAVIYHKQGAYPNRIEEVIPFLTGNAQSRGGSSPWFCAIMISAPVIRNCFRGAILAEFVLARIIAHKDSGEGSAVAFTVRMILAFVLLALNLHALIHLIVWAALILDLIITFCTRVQDTEGMPYMLGAVCLPLLHFIVRPIILWVIGFGVLKLLLIVAAVALVIKGLVAFGKNAAKNPQPVRRTYYAADDDDYDRSSRSSETPISEAEKKRRAEKEKQKHNDEIMRKIRDVEKKKEERLRNLRNGDLGATESGVRAALRKDDEKIRELKNQLK